MKKNPLPIIIKVVLSIVAVFVYYWFKLPPINLRSTEFWWFVCISIIICVIVNAFGDVFRALKSIKKGYDDGESFSMKKLSKPILAALGAVVVIALFSLTVSIVGAEIFHAKSYNQLLTLEESDFVKDVSEISQSQIPVVDRDTAMRLGKRKLGEMSDLVSQFEIADDYTQINFKGKPTRVTPLYYGDVIKWFNNQSNGLPAYISVDMTTQETSLVRLKEGMKYSESEYFMRYIHRYLRFKYPTKIFDTVSFEVDDNGTPYWVASTVEYKIAFWSGKDIGGAVLVNAVTGESEYYDLDKIPTWVDQVFDASLVLEQLEYNGKYRSGFFNSFIGQKGVVKTTDGYNYLANNDDVWLYTGMTSIVSDESNIGFVLVNLRTKESKFYSVPGAEENSAMGSAEGQVQNLKYTSTFPLLLNVSNRPTYFMSLKDDAGLVKMYAFVDVSQYQVVGIGNTVNSARENYISKLVNEDIVDESAENKPKEQNVSGKIAASSSAVIDGNTKYYFMLENDENVYVADISLNERLPFVKVGQQVDITYTEKDGKMTLTKFDVK